METAIQEKTWAVLGATTRTDKFGYKIFKHLVNKGYTVYPVNPNITSIDGVQCYPSLHELPVVPTVVDFVVPEKVGLEALDSCKELGVKTVWLQPGADKPAVVKKATELGLEVIQDCVLIQI
ncbi:CoA binding domain protein [Veillonella sp. DNF00869]|jgi:coA binding domain protein|nr:CoA binding domain protein [Veillonella sp. DNF00869]